MSFYSVTSFSPLDPKSQTLTHIKNTRLMLNIAQNYPARLRK